MREANVKGAVAHPSIRFVTDRCLRQPKYAVCLVAAPPLGLTVRPCSYAGWHPGDGLLRQASELTPARIGEWGGVPLCGNQGAGAIDALGLRTPSPPSPP